jgi:hypothetical protein
VVPYSTRFDEIGGLLDSLRDIANKAKESGFEFGNPVIDFLPHDQIVASSPAEETKGERIAKEEEEEKGLWDFVIDAETSMNTVGQVLSRMTDAGNDITMKMKQRTAEFQQITSNPTPGSSAQMYRAVESGAREISEYADHIDKEIPALRQAWEQFFLGTSGMLRIEYIRSTEDNNAVIQFRGQLNGLITATNQGLDGLKQFRESIRNLRGFSRSMNLAARRTGSALERVIAEFEQAIAYSTKVKYMLDEMIEKYELAHHDDGK